MHLLRSTCHSHKLHDESPGIGCHWSTAQMQARSVGHAQFSRHITDVAPFNFARLAEFHDYELLGLVSLELAVPSKIGQLLAHKP